jgi:hypothetical protein
VLVDFTVDGFGGFARLFLGEDGLAVLLGEIFVLHILYYV